MPGSLDLVGGRAGLRIAAVIFVITFSNAQLNRDHLVSVHHEVIRPANSSAEVGDASLSSGKGISCPSLDELIPGSVAVPWQASACVFGPVWTGAQASEIRLPLKVAQPSGCEVTVSCATGVRNSLAAKSLICNSAGFWVPADFEVASSRTLLPDCQNAVDMVGELNDFNPPKKVAVGNPFWNEAPTDPEQAKKESDVNFGYDSWEYQKAIDSLPTVGYGHPTHRGSRKPSGSPDDDCPQIDDRGQQTWLVIPTKTPIRVGDMVELKCLDDDYYIRSGNTRVCLPGGRWSILEDPECVPKGCESPPQSKIITASYVSCVGPDNKCHVGSDNRFVRQGVEVEYSCREKETDYISGEYMFKCVETSIGYEWRPNQWPTCEKKKACASRLNIANGYFETESVRPVAWGLTATVICNAGYRREGGPYVVCLPTGEWEKLSLPKCISEVDYTSNKFIAMTAIGGLLGLLLIVLLIFLVQRHLWLRKSRVSRRRLMDPPMDPRLAAVVAAHPLSDPDRLALIAFADGLQVPLPSYDEAVSHAISQRRNGPPPFDAISTLSGYANRALRRLPSLSSLRSRDTVPPMRPLRETSDPYSAGDISHNAASDGRPAGSSVETMAVSDVSTAVTAETLSSTGTHSTTASCRANAGSLTESIGSLLGMHSGNGHFAERTHSNSAIGSSSGGSMDSRSVGAGTDIEFAPLLEEEQPVDRSAVVPVTRVDS